VDVDQIAAEKPGFEPQSLLRPPATVAARDGAGDRKDVVLDGGEGRLEPTGRCPPPPDRGCPFWSSPSPLPAPQAARASVTIAIPPRTRAVCLILELPFIGAQLCLPANLAGSAVGGGSAEVINIAMKRLK